MDRHWQETTTRGPLYSITVSPYWIIRLWVQNLGVFTIQYCTILSQQLSMLRYIIGHLSSCTEPFCYDRIVHYSILRFCAQSLLLYVPLQGQHWRDIDNKLSLEGSFTLLPCPRIVLLWYCRVPPSQGLPLLYYYVAFQCGCIVPLGQSRVSSSEVHPWAAVDRHRQQTIIRGQLYSITVSP